MSVSFPRRQRFADPWRSALVALGLACILPNATPVLSQETASSSAEEGQEAEEAGTGDATFLDEVTVTADHVPSSLRDTPGNVSIVTEEDIEDQLFEDIADLVKYEPGVYVEGDATRLGLNGFNIRGIGGNRVLTQVDGVPGAEQFDFGPFNVHQQAIDIDTLKSAEIVRSAGSALYGSDAVGGVISLITKNPSDYLGGGNRHVGLKAGFDGRSNDSNLNLAVAGGGDAARASLFVSSNDGSELDNAGQTGGLGMDRDRPNPQERERLQALGKAVYDISAGNTVRAVFELNSTDAETEVFSALGTSRLGPFTITQLEVLANDTQDRNRASLEQVVRSGGAVDQWSWRFNTQNVDTAQNVAEHRLTASFGPPVASNRDGDLWFEQKTFGADINGLVETGTADSFSSAIYFGGSFLIDEFDMLRDRVEHDLSGRAVPTRLVFPSKYFPQTETEETGVYTQAELRWNRVTLIPGVRYDRFVVDADPSDTVYIAAGGLPAASLDEDAVSPKLGAAIELHRTTTLTAQYAAGFRAPPYSSINTGFTNLAGGYQTIANPDLEPEISDNFELGLRWSAGGTSWSVNGFQNRYDDFIEFQNVGFNRQLRVVEFQNVNLTEVEIDGVEFRLESRLGDNVLLRAAYARIDGHDVTGGTSVPLASVAPNEGVLGLRYLSSSAKWGLDGSVRLVDDRDPEKVADGEHVPEGYEVVDLVAFFALPADMELRIGVLNATDEAYFESWHVRGRQANDPRLLLYSSPGRNVVASLSYNW
ncbi:MAG: TonB-dependent hemoglobin/transferrin/lactoferrin family receptor [Acidobacteria bacterium]|nr:TonB-dependent hemoglobin/transferrin/lactoferrin family receptor [Acidobacteriota bacterium]